MDIAGTDEPRGRSSREALMEAMVTEHETALLRYAARILRDPVAAQDVVQNVFVKLFQSGEGAMRPGPQVKSWLYRVTHNEAVDYIRRESRRRDLHDRQAREPLLERAAGATEPASEDDRKAQVLQQLHRLHPREQQVILLRLEEGLSYADISSITGRSEGNVGNILHHAVRKLSVRLQQAGVIRT